MIAEEFLTLLVADAASATPQKTPQQDNGSPCVFVGQGQSKLWVRLQIFLKDDSNLEIVSYESASRTSESITSILDGMLNRATFAVLVLTAEDETYAGSTRARQNAVHELGLFQGRLGFKKVVLLMQDGVEQFSNIAGIIHTVQRGTYRADLLRADTSA